MKKTDYPKSGHSEAIYSLREIFGHFGHLFGPFLTISQNPLCSRGLRYYGMILLYIWVRFIHFPPLVDFSSLKTPSRYIIPIWPLPALPACLCVWSHLHIRLLSIRWVSISLARSRLQAHSWIECTGMGCTRLPNAASSSSTSSKTCNKLTANFAETKR